MKIKKKQTLKITKELSESIPENKYYGQFLQTFRLQKRKIVKTLAKLNKQKQYYLSIIFGETCIKGGLLPKYTIYV